MEPRLVLMVSWDFKTSFLSWSLTSLQLHYRPPAVCVNTWIDFWLREWCENWKKLRELTCVNGKINTVKITAHNHIVCCVNASIAKKRLGECVKVLVRWGASIIKFTKMIADFLKEILLWFIFGFVPFGGTFKGVKKGPHDLHIPGTIFCLNAPPPAMQLCNTPLSENVKMWKWKWRS